MYNTAMLAEHMHWAQQGYGFDVDVKSFSWPTIKAKRDAYVKRLNGIYDRNLERAEIERIKGWARFKEGDPHSVVVGDDTYSAKHVLVAVGGEPNVPSLPGAEHGITSDGFFELEDLPKKVAIVGAGYIAVELSG